MLGINTTNRKFRKNKSLCQVRNHMIWSSTAPAAAVLVLLSGSRQHAPHMQEDFHSELAASSAGGDAASAPDVTAAAADVARLLKFKEEEESLMKKYSVIWADEGQQYLDERPNLVGTLGSAELLARDEQEDMYPLHLSADPHEEQMVFVDELRCVGCRYCAAISRSTFAMVDGDLDFGTARVVQQGAEEGESIQEAIDSCPADCIHFCSRTDLETLETHRKLHFDDLMAKFQSRRLVGGGGQHSSMSVPHWRDPLTHTSWMQGPRYVKEQRARLADPLLPRGGEVEEEVEG